ncbi:hypothetical protein BXZ70DRAFT_907149 [Cristinia sonorae]|uniref:Extracellular serine-rich protein n=1 Tax=Cristinia sonorae TaxID=1940300 RepID=A0A8K0UP63_9AGAR|nr:hypothetical protein BXZ70DRAFT_907149 [Cristinia sonorae]
MLSKIATLIPLVGLAQAAVFTVTVGIVETDGKPGLGFDPSSIRPSAGDTITFTYQFAEWVKDPPTNQHTATQSTFENPCTPLPGGFDTGIQTTGSILKGTGASFDLAVNNTDPLWFFSAANQDCKAGMVLSVNPPLSGEQTAAAFVERAKASTPAPPPSSSSSGTSSGAGTSTSDSTAPTSPPSTGGSISLDGRQGLALAGLATLMGIAFML